MNCLLGLFHAGWPDSKDQRCIREIGVNKIRKGQEESLVDAAKATPTAAACESDIEVLCTMAPDDMAHTAC
eukprot:12417489-Karenia_brevis.AAC.1